MTTGTRSRRRRLVAPVATGAAALVGLGYLWAVDPSVPGRYPLCPTRWLLGIDCPGCGMLRGGNCLLHGDVGGALDHNLLLVAAVPLVVALWLAWLVRAWRGEPTEPSSRRARAQAGLAISATVVVVAFGVVRNFVPYLGSGLS